MKLFIDLFAGLCGASQAFVDSKNWEVLAIDDNQLCIDSVMGTPGLKYFRRDLSNPADSIKFIENYIARGNYSEIAIWASPPCTEFSDANANRPANPSMVLLESTIAIIEAIEPDSWFLENVKGACREFMPYLGVHRQKMKSFFVWGNFPYVGVPIYTWRKEDAWSTNPLRANIRAKVPLELSQAILEALENQTRIDYWSVPVSRSQSTSSVPPYSS